MGLATSLRARAAAAWLLLGLTAGCVQTLSPPPDRYVGSWESSEDHLRIDRNGLGEGRVIRGRTPRPFTWEHGIDRITITFDGSKRPERFDARIDAQGFLVVSSARTEVRLARVATLSGPADAGADPARRGQDDARDAGPPGPGHGTDPAAIRTADEST